MNRPIFLDRFCLRNAECTLSDFDENRFLDPESLVLRAMKKDMFAARGPAPRLQLCASIGDQASDIELPVVHVAAPLSESESQQDQNALQHNLSLGSRVLSPDHNGNPAYHLVYDRYHDLCLPPWFWTTG